MVHFLVTNVVKFLMIMHKKTEFNGNVIVTIEDLRGQEGSCADFKYTYRKDGYSLLFDLDEQSNELCCLGLEDYCRPRKVVVPSEIVGHPVTKISFGNRTDRGEGPFAYNDWIEEIALPRSLKEIDAFAFSECSGIERISIPENVTKIGLMAFWDCSNLKEITLPNSLIELGDQVFGGCNSLRKIVIPKSVEEIGDGVLIGCKRLSSIKVAKGNKMYDSRNNCKAIIRTKDNTLLASCMDTIIPDTIVSCEFAFSRREDVKEFIVPKSIVKVGNSSFSGCKQLKSIALHDSVIEIGERAFEFCGLETITLPSSITHIGHRAFMDCKELKNVMLSDSLREIEEYAFYGCTALEELVIPNSVTSIGENAFKDCKSLKRIIVKNAALLENTAISTNVKIIKP